MRLHKILPRPLRWWSIPVMIISLIPLLASCSNNTAEPTREISIGEVQVTVVPPTQVRYSFKTSEPGTITVHGSLVVLNPTSMLPAPGDSIYLVPMPEGEPISMIPQFEVGTVPQADVNETNGEYVFTNLQPGQYAVVVITSGGAQIPVRYFNTSNYAIFTLEDSEVDTTVEIGELSLP